ncbi:hypothetical protein [Nocardioides convexus]|uniref:hypothetical protein n=1 Tax=Nocardioides convexus TaxID=2712224 RepID=UPI00241838E0|nr:hypothetical protein [Nocardioides convexus]
MGLDISGDALDVTPRAAVISLRRRDRGHHAGRLPARPARRQGGPGGGHADRRRAGEGLPAASYGHRGGGAAHRRRLRRGRTGGHQRPADRDRRRAVDPHRRGDQAR